MKKQKGNWFAREFEKNKLIFKQAIHNLSKNWMLGLTFAICFSSFASMMILVDSLHTSFFHSDMYG